MVEVIDRMNDSRPMSEAAMRNLYNRARAAGLAAGEAAKPAGMLVGTPKDPMASLMGKETGFDLNKPVYAVSEGVCGFAWVTVRPGNSRFANWLRKNGLARADRYAGGMQIWVGEFGQSMQRKEAYARAFADVLTAAGITAYDGSRMD